jgi:hypothetical protein
VATALRKAAGGASPWEGTGFEDEPDFSALVGSAGWNRLDAEIRRRFSAGHAAVPVVYEGRMRLWRSAAGLVFAIVARLIGGPLPIRAEDGVPTEVRVYRDGAGGIVWERWLRFPGARAACVRSTKRCGPAGMLLEVVDGGLGMTLSVFEENAALVFESRSYFLHCGEVRIPLPALLTPGRCKVAHEPISRDRFRFTMTMEHPLWGCTFRQVGEFQDPEA